MTDEADTGHHTELDELSTPVISAVPFDLISQHERKTSKLINNSPDHQSLKSQSKYFDFVFKEPLFIHSIRVMLSDFQDHSEFKYRWAGIDGKIHEGDARSAANQVDVLITGVATSVGFKPPRAYFSQPFVKGVTIFGFELAGAGKFLNFARQLESLKTSAMREIEAEKKLLEKREAEIGLLESQRTTLNQDISKAKSALSREHSKLKDAEIQKNNLIAQAGELERSVSDEESRLQTIKYEVSRLSKTRSTLASRIQQKNSILSELQSNINLFPSELSSFSTQGWRDSKIFSTLAFLPLLLIGTMFLMLVLGSADLSTKIDYTKDLNIPALIASRAPYVAIAGSIITASYYIARMLILEVIRISRQRLSLTKIGIIAKDISSSIDEDLNLTDEERYHKRLQLKMDLMRDHLKEYISSDFQPTLPKNLIPTLMGRVSKEEDDGGE